MSTEVPCVYCDGDGWTAETDYCGECYRDGEWCGCEGVQVQEQCRVCKGLGTHPIGAA